MRKVEEGREEGGQRKKGREGARGEKGKGWRRSEVEGERRSRGKGARSEILIPGTNAFCLVHTN